MTTARDIITQAFRKIGVASAYEVLDADQMTSGLFALNAMLHGWKLYSADLEHTDYAEGSAFALGPEFVEPVVYLLAARLAESYMVPPPDRLVTDDAWRRVRATFPAVPVEMTMDSGLQRLPSQYRTGNQRLTF